METLLNYADLAGVDLQEFKEKAMGNRNVIIVAEDNLQFRKEVSGMLRDQGFDVIEARHGGEARQIFHNLQNTGHNVAAIVTDQEMRGHSSAPTELDGHELIRVLKEDGFDYI